MKTRVSLLRFAAASGSVTVPKPITLTVEVDGQTNGKSRSVVSKFFKKEFDKAFAKIQNVTLAQGGGKVHIVANNRGETAEAARKGAASGFTMGIMGVEVTDHYDFTFTYIPPAGASFAAPTNTRFTPLSEPPSRYRMVLQR